MWITRVGGHRRQPVLNMATMKGSLRSLLSCAVFQDTAYAESGIELTPLSLPFFF